MKHATKTILALAVGVLLAGPAVASPDEAGWTTATDYPEIGAPNANRDSKKTHRIVWRDFPPTLRTDGPNSNLTTTRTVHDLMFESLIQIHPNTEEFIPFLANEWKIETDKKAGTQTFSFKIDPKAKWADGSPVTAEDVHKSFWHRVQEDRSDPSNVLTFNEGFNEPVIVDERTIKVTTKKLNWRLFLYFGGMISTSQGFALAGMILAGTMLVRSRIRSQAGSR
jgi:ABC-type transport system substrate-binding protein